MLRTAAAVAIALALSAPALLAQAIPDPLTLEDALRIAEAQSPDYRMAMNDLDRAEVVERQSFRSTFFPQINPSLSFSGSQYRRYTVENFDGSLLEEPLVSHGRSSQSTQAIRASMTLFSGPNLMRYRQARIQSRLTGAQVEASIAGIRASVTRLYFAALQAEAAVEVEERLLARAADNLEVAERRFRVGTSQLEDVLGARIEFERRQLALERARGQAYKARLDLLEAMGVEGEPDFALAGSLPEPFDPALLDAGELVAAALRASPRIRQADAALRASEAGKSAARANRLPTLFVDASWIRRRATPDFESLFELNPKNSDYNVSVVLSVPIPLLRFDQDAQIAQAELALADAEEAYRKERIALQNDVRAALIDLRDAYENVRLAEREAEVRREQVAIVEERFRSGGSVDYLRLEQVWDQAAQAERAVLDARVAFHNVLLNLEQLVGREVAP